MGLGSYEAYRNGRHWRRLRNNLKAGKPQCMGCNKYRATELHHLTYDRLGREKYRNLIALCRNCHQSIHDELDLAFPGSALELQVLETSEVFQKATGASWREAMSRWDWYLAGLARNTPKLTKKRKYAPKKSNRKKRKGDKHRQAMKRMKKREFVTFVCPSCEYRVSRPVETGLDLPCRCGLPIQRERVSVTATSTADVLGLAASMPKTMVLSVITIGELGSANAPAETPPFACNEVQRASR